jgi:hypothetical protein
MRPGLGRALDPIMETRELYKQKYQAQIHEWAAKLDVLKARGEKMSAQTKLDAKPRLVGMYTQLDAAKAKMAELASATDDKWEEAKKGAEHAWTETKSALEGAYDAVMSMGPADAAPVTATAEKKAKTEASKAPS